MAIYEYDYDIDEKLFLRNEITKARDSLLNNKDKDNNFKLAMKLIKTKDNYINFLEGSVVD